MNKIIYGLIAIAIVLVVCAMISVANTIDVSRSKAKTETSKWYSNPSTLGRFWVVEQNGIKIEHVRCIYWSSTNDYSIFETEEGKLIFVNGSSIVYQE